MVNVWSFTASIKCSWIERLVHINGMDIFLAVNRNDIVQKLHNFGDSFMLKKNIAFLKRCYNLVINLL